MSMKPSSHALVQDGVNHLSRRIDSLNQTRWVAGRLKPEHIRTGSLLVVVLVVLGFYVHFTKHFVPARNAARSAQTENLELLSAANEAEIQAQEVEKSIRDMRKTLTGLHAERVRLDAQQSKLAARMVASNDLSTLEEIFAVIAEQTGIDITALEKKKIKRSAEAAAAIPFSRMIYSIEGRGDCPATIAFLSVIERGPWPIRIVTAEILEPKGDETRSRLTIDIQLLTPDDNFRHAPPPLAPLPKSLTAVKIRDIFPDVQKEVAVVGEVKAPVDWGVLDLTGIMGADNNRVAIVNGIILRKDSVLNGAHVLAVNDTTILLEKEGEQKTLTFGSALPDTNVPGANPTEMRGQNR